MKKYLTNLLPVILSFVIFSCASSSPFQIKNESPAKPSLNKFTKIYVGWMDLREKDWKRFGYESKKHWKEVIKEMNIKVLRKYLKEFLPDKKFRFARPKSKRFPNRRMGQLYIKFKSCKIDDNYSVIYGGDDYLNVKIEFYNITKNTKKRRKKRKIKKIKIFSASISASSYATLPQDLFEYRLYNEVYNLANYISQKFKKQP